MISYDWPRECTSFGGWLLFSWFFLNGHGQREHGIRVLGVTFSNEKELEAKR